MKPFRLHQKAVDFSLGKLFGKFGSGHNKRSALKGSPQREDYIPKCFLLGKSLRDHTMTFRGRLADLYMRRAPNQWDRQAGAISGNLPAEGAGQLIARVFVKTVH
jgi:hypothetical protein